MIGSHSFPKCRIRRPSLSGSRKLESGLDLKIGFLGKINAAFSTSCVVVSFSRDRECQPSFADGNSDKTSAINISYSTVEEMSVLDDSVLLRLW